MLVAISISSSVYRTARIFRARSKSGSPPHPHRRSKTPVGNGYSSFLNDPSDLSLPPITATSNVSSASSLGFFSASSASSANNRLRSQKSNLTSPDHNFKRALDHQISPTSTSSKPSQYGKAKPSRNFIKV